MDVATRSVLLTTVQCLKKKVRQPGIEPGSIAWKATMLTFTPPTLFITRRLKISDILSVKHCSCFGEELVALALVSYFTACKRRLSA